MAISRETIVDASVTILNRDGIEGLSMRLLAKELDIKAASLYWHFKGKEELYGAIAEHLCTQLVLPDNTADAKSYLFEAHKRYRAMLLGTRDAVAICENSIPSTPKRLEIIGAIGDKMLEFGVKEKNLMTASNLVNNYVLSFVADEYRFKNTPPEKMQELEKLMTAREMQLLRSSSDYDEQFLYGLNVLFAGLDAVEV
jgi:AcrR family transcriptional regulator